MALSVDWSSKIISVPQSDLDFVSGIIYEHDVDAFQRELSDIEDSEAGVAHLPMHRHNTEITLAGVTYIRSVEIINGYTVTYENGNYRVNLVGANNNIIDVLNYNSVQVVPNNSAGLIKVTTGSGVTEQDKTDIIQGLLTQDMSSVSGEAERSLLNAIRKLVNRVARSGDGEVTIYKEDDATPAYTQTAIVDSTLKPIKELK